MPRLTRLALSVCLFLMLAGCSKPQPASPKTVNFTCSFIAHYQDLTVGGTLTRYTQGTLTLDFTEPETLRDVRALWDGETMKVQYLGITFDIDDAKIPETALGKQLLFALDNALGADGIQNKDTVTISGSVDGAAYTYIYAADSGLPLSLSVPSLPLEVTFSHVTLQE